MRSLTATAFVPYHTGGYHAVTMLHFQGLVLFMFTYIVLKSAVDAAVAWSRRRTWNVRLAYTLQTVVYGVCVGSFAFSFSFLSDPSSAGPVPAWLFWFVATPDAAILVVVGVRAVRWTRRAA